MDKQIIEATEARARIAQAALWCWLRCEPRLTLWQHVDDSGYARQVWAETREAAAASIASHAELRARDVLAVIEEAERPLAGYAMQQLLCDHTPGRGLLSASCVSRNVCRSAS